VCASLYFDGIAKRSDRHDALPRGQARAGWALGLFFCGRGLDGADFDVGWLAGIVDAEAGDPYLTVAEHGSLIVDEQVFVLLILNDGCYVGGDDVVVVLDEGFWRVEIGGFAVELYPDGVVNESGYGGGIVFSDSLLEVGEDQMDFGVGVLAKHGVDGRVYF
jgi:hypothetical protein